MPLYFWNDPDGARYRDATSTPTPGVWRHGDWITVTARGTEVIHGRSDSTLNREGVRMGTADIYGRSSGCPRSRDSLVIGLEQPDGGYWMPLFVVLADGALDDVLRGRSGRRSANSSPRATSRTRSSPSRRSRTPSPARSWRFRQAARPRPAARGSRGCRRGRRPTCARVVRGPRLGAEPDHALAVATI